MTNTVVTVELQEDPIEVNLLLAPIGPRGIPGAGVPTGGAIGQVLVKNTTADYDTKWVDDAAPGLDKQVLFNDGGQEGSDANLLYDKASQTLSVGKPSTLPTSPIAAGGNVDSYVQVTVQNNSPGIFASSDFVATADNGSDSTHFIDLGINNSNYNDPNYSAGKGDDGYLIMVDGDLAIGPTSDGKVTKLLAGGATSSDIVAEVSADGIDLQGSRHVSENGFNLIDMITECNSAVAEAAAFAAGAKIVIRTDLL